MNSGREQLRPPDDSRIDLTNAPSDSVMACSQLAMAIVATSDWTLARVNRAFTELVGHPEADLHRASCRIFDVGQQPEGQLSTRLRHFQLGDEPHGRFEVALKHHTPARQLDVLVHVDRLLPAGRHLLLTLQNVTEERRELEQVRRLAHYDPLTELPNRRLFMEQFQLAMATVRRRQEPLSLMFVDLNRFKEVNDSLGHAAGDNLLRDVAGAMRRCLRESDVVGRLGGDEFAAALPTVSRDEATIAAQRILETITQQFELMGFPINVGASIGISVYPSDGTLAADLLRHADIAMYRAKEQQSGVHYFDPADAAQIESKYQLKRELELALAMGQLSLVYQPRFDLATRRITSVEALLRWCHPTRGMLSPDEFLPLAEEAGLMPDLGHDVIHQACQQARAWGDKGIDLRISINISGKELERGDLVASVRDALQTHGVSGKQLEIEISEADSMRNATRSLSVMRELKTDGVFLGIDDFGTGYSSLAYLNCLPTDFIKIDSLFVKAIGGEADLGSNNVDLIRAIIKLADTLNVITVAEGVETMFQMELLEAMGCHSAQGYLFSPPVSAEEIEVLLHASEHDRLLTNA